MSWSTLYPAKINSPATTINETLSDSDTTITVTAASVLPAGPNIAVIGTGEDAETILYTAISGNDLTGVTRGFQGTAKAWSAGSQISRLFTAYDFDTLKQNVTDLKDTRSSNLFKQAIINGGFDIWQLGETFTNPANNSYTADCWKVAFSTGGGSNPTLVHAKQMAVDGLNLYRINSNGAGSSLGANSYYSLVNHVENGTKKICHGRKVTVSFVASSTIANYKLGFCLAQNYGTGGSPTAEEIINGTNVALASSETLFSYTFTTNSLTGKTFGTDVNSSHLKLIFYVQWGSALASRVGAGGAQTFVGSGNIEIRNVVVNVAEYAFPFEGEREGETLLKSMRFFEKSYQYLNIPGTNTFKNAYFLNGTTDASGAIRVVIDYKVQKRIIPALTLYQCSGASNYWQYTRSGVATTTETPNLDQQGVNGWSGYINTGGNWAACNTQGHWVADARY